MTEITEIAVRTKRVRWRAGDRDEIVAWFGYAGTVNTCLFQILRPLKNGTPGHRFDDWALCATFPGARSARYAYSLEAPQAVEELKEQAERWLEEFAASLGASFRSQATTDVERVEGAANVLERRYPGTRPEPLQDAMDTLWSIARSWRRQPADAAEAAEPATAVKVDLECGHGVMSAESDAGPELIWWCGTCRCFQRILGNETASLGPQCTPKPT